LDGQRTTRSGCRPKFRLDEIVQRVLIAGHDAPGHWTFMLATSVRAERQSLIPGKRSGLWDAIETWLSHATSK
jgi:hypothetical protein